MIYSAVKLSAAEWLLGDHQYSLSNVYKWWKSYFLLQNNPRIHCKATEICKKFYTAKSQHFTYGMENVTITFIIKPISSDTVWYVSVIKLGIFSDKIRTNYKSFMVRKLSWFSRIFSEPRKFSLLNFYSAESWQHEKYSTVVAKNLSAKRLGSNLQKKLTRKWLAICFISDSLQL